MRRPIVLALSFLAACGDNLDRVDPVDMTFVADVAELENTCDDRPLAADAEVFVDAIRAADGTVELREWGRLIPGPGVFPNVRPHAGAVSYDARRYSSYPDKTYPYRIEGTLAMEAMDLTFTERWYRSPDFADCVRKVRVVGKPRGFREAASLDGRYEIMTSYYGEVCGNDPLPERPLGERVYVLDAHPRPTGLAVILGGAIFLEPPVPGADGLVDWTGRLYFSGVEGVQEVEGSLRGTFAPGDVRAELGFRTEDQPADCRHAYVLGGAKRAAEPSDVGGDYAAVYRVRSECEGTTVAYEAPLIAVRQGPDEIEFLDEMGDWFIDADGRTLHETDGTEAEGQTATFSGSYDPPYLSYTVEFRTFAGDGSSCAYAWDVDATLRYAPEFAWDPAFRPDPPNPNDKTGILRRVAPRALPTKAFMPGPSLGPLSP